MNLIALTTVVVMLASYNVRSPQLARHNAENGAERLNRVATIV
jgi:hypothetical protein